ncbi:MAG: redox-regulated molecular chaperone Hsp33 [Acidobacteria bacterium]|nr:MAG: redox-regulated molecular chaperone Hsp33 [Acidobacteriota bacterium]
MRTFRKASAEPGRNNFKPIMVLHGTMEQGDRLIQGMAEGGDFRILAAGTTRTVDTARELLDLAPVATDALGRALTGSILMARLLDKNVKHQYVTLRFEGDGPLGVMIAEANVAGAARGWVANPVPLDETLDVSRAIGRGLLTVVRGTPPAGKPYTSQIELKGSGVAQELTRYLARSEQMSSAVLLGVLNRRRGVAAAGGILIQAFPHASADSVERIEQRIKEAPPLSTLLEKMPIEDVVAAVFHGCHYKQIDSSFNVALSYSCSCSRERALAPLQLFAPDELREMVAQGGSEVVCQFCGRKYRFSAGDLLALNAKPDA